MKRKSPRRPRESRVIEAHRLTDVRGGGGITIKSPGPTPLEMLLQHNETLVRCRPAPRPRRTP
jgi:hypothetical protein